MMDCDALEYAIDALERSRDYLRSDAAKGDPGIREQFELATVKAFEVTWTFAMRLTRKKMREMLVSTDAFGRMDFRDQLREAADYGLVRDPRPFFRYRDLLAGTVDADLEERRKALLPVLDEFLNDVRALLEQLKTDDQ